MHNHISIKITVANYILVLLILSQFSNALLVTDFLVNKDKIALNSDVDNNTKEDKNTFDSEEETKILEDFFHAIGFSVELNSFNDLIQNLPEALNTEDFPPPEQSPLV